MIANRLATTGTCTTSGKITIFCMSHSIRAVRVRANQHVRTEYGECINCGLPHKRVIDWGKHKVAGWTKELKEEQDDMG